MDINYSLLWAVRNGNLRKTQDLVNRYGLSYSQGWSDGYVLLRSALENEHTDIAKLLLSSGAKVNSKSQKKTSTPLHLAVQLGDLDTVEMLLQKHAEVDARDAYETTPLHIAAKLGHLDIVRSLLKYGASRYITDSNERTSLHLSVRYGHEEVTVLLLENDVRVDAKTKEGCTALYIASEFGYSQIVKILLNHGANINDPINNGYTPLHVALKKNNADIVKILVNNNARINFSAVGGISPLHVAAKRGNEEVIKLLLIHGAEINMQDDTGKTALYYAIEINFAAVDDVIVQYAPNIDIKSNNSAFHRAIILGKSSIVRRLLQYGFSVGPEDIKDSALFHAAISKGYIEIIEHFLKLGVDVNMKDSVTREANMPLHNAVKHQHKELVILLLKHGADVNAKDETGAPAFLYAIKGAHVNILNKKEIIEILVKHGADINASDTYGRTALHLTVLDRDTNFLFFETCDDAVKEIQADIADLLLRNGLDVNARTKGGLTALHMAAQNGYAKVVETLLKYNADVDFMGKLGMTALHLSAKLGNELISKMLLEKGANVNARCKRNLSYGTGKTPLHIATHYRRERTVKLLLLFGADVDSLNSSGRSALHIACKNENADDTIDILLGYGSDINILDIWHQTPFNYVKETTYSYKEYDNFRLEDTDDDYYEDLNADRDYTPEAFNVKRHIVKMVAANLYVHERNLKRINCYDYADFQCECRKEIKSLVAEKIANSKVSFHDVLTRDARQLVAFVRNEDMVKVLESNDYDETFPIYASIIRGRFRKALMRKNLVDQGHSCFQLLFKNCPQVPFNCTEIILNFLSNADIRNLIDATLKCGGDSVFS